METNITIINDHNNVSVDIHHLDVIPKIGECLSVTEEDFSMNGVVTKVEHVIGKYHDYNDKTVICHDIIIHIW